MIENSSVFDVNKIAGEAIASLLKDAVTSAANSRTRKGKLLEASCATTFYDYYVDSLRRYSRTKTILYRNEPVPLYEFFIPLDLAAPKGMSITNVTANSLASAGRCFILSGTAGCGKSTLLKHLFVDGLAQKVYLPLLVELRDLSSDSQGLKAVICELLARYGESYDQADLANLFKQKPLAILLDGFDELPQQRQQVIGREIRDLAAKYKNAKWIMTSRPDSSFVSWSDFHELEVQSLTKEKAVRLINALSYDSDVKDRFIKELEGGLFERHRGVLSVPLLLTIILMTYERNAAIPAKISTFYAQVFETLFNHHDATKGGYQRQTFCNLGREDYERVLCQFCIRTYIDSKTKFLRNELQSLLADARDASGLSFNTVDFTNDLLRSFCILSQDGLEYKFTHRSFQEYFAALFVSSATDELRGALMPAVSSQIEANFCFQMLHEMNPSVVEQEVILPRLSQLPGMAESSPPEIGDFAQFIVSSVNSIQFENGMESRWELASSGDFIFFYYCLRHYGIEPPSPSFPLRTHNTSLLPEHLRDGVVRVKDLVECGVAESFFAGLSGTISYKAYCNVHTLMCDLKRKEDKNSDLLRMLRTKRISSMF